MMMIKRFDTTGQKTKQLDFQSDYPDPEEARKLLPMSKTTSRDEREKV
jgi:hypothetical protein